MGRSRIVVLAAASAGGHWTQLLRLRPAWEGCDVAYVTTDPSLADAVISGSRFYSVAEASRWEKAKLVKSAIQVAGILIRERPDVIITTGAAVGYFAILFGRLLGCRTLWIDSIANAEEVSLSGQKAGRIADLFLTQWPELEKDGGPTFKGSVL